MEARATGESGEYILKIFGHEKILLLKPCVQACSSSILTENKKMVPCPFGIQARIGLLFPQLRTKITDKRLHMKTK